MAQSLNELKIGALKRGFWFTEMLSTQEPECMAVEINKCDPHDNMRFSVTHHMYFSNYLDPQKRFQAFYDGIDMITKSIAERDVADMMKCEHTTVQNFGKVTCTKCRAVVGQVVTTGEKVNYGISLN